jgi:hypothetical protein
MKIGTFHLLIILGKGYGYGHTPIRELFPKIRIRKRDNKYWGLFK